MAVSGVSDSEVDRATAAALEALRGVLPAPADRAGRALDTIRRAWRATGDGVHRGRLTAGGFPLEIVCSTGDARVRYTCDVAGSAVAPEQRLKAARALLASLDVHSPFPLARLQEEGSPLRWGAWLGGRHGADSDSYKLYVEAPAVLSGAAALELRAALGRYGGLLDSHVLSLRLMGTDAAAQRVECYFRARSLQWDQLGRLMHLAGLADRLDELGAVLEDATHTPVRERLPGTQHGFSISMTGDGNVEAFSVFGFARALFGSTARIRQGLLECAERQGWNLAAYAAVSAPLATCHEADSHHGLVSWLVPRDRPLGLSVGLRPPFVGLPPL